MNDGKYVFSQFVEFIPNRIFDRCVEKYDGDYKIQHFSCWNQLLSMIFGQLCRSDSLRDLVVGLSAHKNKFYHLGLGKNVSKTNLAKANEIRDYRIFEEFFYQLVKKAVHICISDLDIQTTFESNIYAFDSTLIELCMSMFPWAKYRKGKSAVKIHTLFDVKKAIPKFIYISDGLTHDIHGLDKLEIEKGSFYALDRGYIDYERLYKIHKKDAFFVTRAKKNCSFKRIYSQQADKATGVIFDQIGKFENFYAQKDYPEKIRCIKFYDKQTDKTFKFLTNNVVLPAFEIALLYKYRWQVELFFKWIKQHLKIKKFWGTTPNAVKVHIYIALSTYLLVSIVKHTLKINRSNYEIIQILKVSLLDKTPINELLTKQYYKDVKEPCCNQLSIF
jgi:hypothetical protein